MNCQACKKTTETRCPECGRPCCPACISAADGLNVCCAAQVAEEWRNLQPGDHVVVARPVTETERSLLGRRFVFDRFTKPHGYAVVGDVWGKWRLHPECLDPIEEEVSKKVDP